MPILSPRKSESNACLSEKKALIQKLLIFSILIGFQNFSIAQPSDTIKPKIGLVLSGGGAKGLAHIGVLKILEKHKIPVHYVTGTSMGSIIGALYSIGYSADKIEEIALSMNWDEIFNGSTPRKLISIEEKDIEGKFILEIPVDKGKPVIPTGLISSQKLEMELANITWSVHGMNNFSKFRIPFACVATDIETGEAVVFNKGYLPDVLRASMAIPSVFTAVEIDGRLLVDGGLVRNFPVSDAKKMGADIIIGVDVTAPLYKKEELNSMLKILEQAASFPNEKTNELEKELVDLYIKPDISGYDASSFGASEILIKIGEKAAISLEKELMELKHKYFNEPDSVEKVINPPSLHSIFINQVRFDGLSNVSLNLVRSKFNIKDSAWVTLKEIEKWIAVLYGSRYFEKVGYRIEQTDKKTDLVVRLVEQPFSIYKVGLNYNNVFNASLLLNASWRNLLGDGSRLVISSKLGFMPEFSADYTIFTKWKPSVGFRAHAGYYYLKGPVYGYNDSLNIEIAGNYLSGRMGFASALNNSTLLTFGGEFSYRFFKSKSIEYKDQIPEMSGIQLFGQLKFDNFDRNVFPVSGAYFETYISYVFNELNRSIPNFDNQFWKFSLVYHQRIPLAKKWNMSFFFRSGINFSEKLFFADQYFLGGEINFKNQVFSMSGYKFMQIMAYQIVTTGIGLRFEPWNNKFIAAEINGGIAEKSIEDIFQTRDFYLGGSIGIGVNTLLGPIEYKIGLNGTDNQVNHWIQIGFFF
jgi:NTE family protein